MKLKIRFTILFLSCFATMLHAEKRKVLMIGNSYIYTNDLPTMLKDLALSMGDSLEITSSTPGGYSFNQHSTNTTTLALIAQGGWDYVVLQAQSQEPSFPPSQVSTQTYPFAKKLDSLVHVSNPCAETIFFMTWGKKNGDAGNCGSYPILCTYAGVYARLRESYLQMTQDNQATCAPVGVAWDRIITTQPSIELFVSDGSHPNPNGTYLTACTFYATLFHKSCAGAQYVPAMVTNSNALLFQTTASNTVLDSLENWQQYGKLPMAKFSHSNTQNQYLFNNQSLRSTQYEWNFGDGTPISIQTNPSHTFVNAGNYTVSLTAKNACGKYAIHQKTIQVTTTPNSISSTNKRATQVFYSQGTLLVKNAIPNEEIQLFDTNGRTLLKVLLKNTEEHIDLNQLSSGMYFYKIIHQKKESSNGSFLIP